ncbi:DUF4166 domain-containing protein [Phaeobacter marinintestinus]|uniref:DUF4166 domain-containing protein n=1 Tax=Falsiphaeobacter marinintestinus TaxID=1492905 RepID=UPI0011B64B09|nr:DUF4166 domain-containing protein [Phaeobacter marinintestinus]
MTTVYARLLGTRLAQLSDDLQAVHMTHGRFCGRITVSVSQNPVLRHAAGLAGFPPATDDAPFVFSTHPDGKADIWTRQIGATVMTSRLWITDDGLLAEKMGAVTAISALLITPDGGLALQLRRFQALGCPIPFAAAPRVRATERGQGGAYRFDVAIGLPILRSNLVHYRGHLSI